MAGFTLALFALLAFAKEKYSCDLDIYQLKGKVKELQETKISYDTTGPNPTMYVYYRITRKFNEQGNGVETFYFSRGDTVIRRESEVYRPYGNGQIRESYVTDLLTGSKKKQQEYVYSNQPLFLLKQLLITQTYLLRI